MRPLQRILRNRSRRGLHEVNFVVRCIRWRRLAIRMRRMFFGGCGNISWWKLCVCSEDPTMLTDTLSDTCIRVQRVDIGRRWVGTLREAHTERHRQLAAKMALAEMLAPPESFWCVVMLLRAGGIVFWSYIDASCQSIDLGREKQASGRLLHVISAPMTHRFLPSGSSGFHAHFWSFVRCLDTGD